MIYAIIVAAGKGLRMKSNRRKQFLEIDRRPILSHTLQVFENCRTIDQIIVVLPPDDISYCRRHIINAAGHTADTRLVAGGNRRQDSVCNGLDSISEHEGIVLIHDGVRPLVTEALIENCIKGAQKWGACIPALSPVDTLKEVDNGVVTKTISRENLRLVQTPQAFSLSLIRQAHLEAKRNNWSVTDDASLVERIGAGVHTISGLRENIKITSPHDLGLADYYLSRRQ